MTIKTLKKQQLRNNEYYDTQKMFDSLYQKSKYKNNYKFYNLMELITDKNNIELAYRNIKTNKGSKTKGINRKTIDDISKINNGNYVEYIQNRLRDYKPHKVRRVEIRKDNGKMRPLGIPTIEDRLIQQSIKQVLEPICEAKFYNHNYGFRPNRGTHDAISRAVSLANRGKLGYVVDIDIKGFFDNVNHGKLLKQMWSMGIQDKQLLCVISKMLKAPIKGIGIPTKGTPQGGILSPLLSNIVLNELDWWIAGQWENFNSEIKYTKQYNKYRALKRCNLKEIYIVRYADDFKIFCRNHKVANKVYHATKKWLKERLKLEISEEKSKIVNLKKNYSEYLGIKMKLHKKGKRQVIKSHLSDKSKRKLILKLKNQIKNIRKHTTVENVNKYNSIVLGAHNYYKIATHVNLDFKDIAFCINKSITNRLKIIRSKTGLKSQCYNKFYGNYNYKNIYIMGVALFPIAGVTTKPPMNFNQSICNYTDEGREKIHNTQMCADKNTIKYLLENPIPSESIEYNDNRLSLYCGQLGVCAISKEPLEIGNMECHHIIPRKNNGSDKYDNLILLKTEIHKLIHATNKETINRYENKLNLGKNAFKKVEILRNEIVNSEIKNR
ncbi:MAG: group II intron reverse transcriptase/maturase [Paraclostridium sp.]